MDRFETLRRSTKAALCVACGKCSTMCPLAPGEDFSARRIVHQELDHHDVGPGVGVHRCLTCGSCELRCPQGVRITDFVRGLREVLPSQTRRPYPHGGVFQRSAGLQARGRESSPRPAWLTEDLRVADEGEVALFVGCLPLFDRFFQDKLGVETLEIARSAVRILNRLGVEPVIVADESCCGHDLLWSGDHEGFAQLARANVAAFAERGVKHIIATCAECCRTWSLDYPQQVEGYRPKVSHMSEILADKLETDDLPLGSSDSNPVTYQDPCRLGRHLGVHEAPRKALRAAPDLDLVEMRRSGRDAQCCGTSGFIHCDAESRRLQEERLRSAEETGANTLVTACPKCLIHFSCAKAEDERRGERAPAIELMDFTVLMDSIMGNGETPNPSPARKERAIGAPQ